MSISHLLFGFDGRINRKTYIIAVIVLMLVVGALMVVGAALVTGDPFSSTVWTFRRENIGVWGPIYGGVTDALALGGSGDQAPSRSQLPHVDLSGGLFLPGRRGSRVLLVHAGEL
ncbi:MAG TPA: hypothetical protein VLW88_05775 [Hyphomicrobium sp.]|nr:hypothetical protein [Hyphomicrobium sp.]